MILSDEAAFIILAMIVGFVLLVIGTGLLGLFLFARGYRLIGSILVLGVVAFIVVPLGIDGMRSVQLRALMETRNTLPTDLPLEGRRILFIEGGSTLCNRLCLDVLNLGVDAEVYWIGMGNNVPSSAVENPSLTAVLDARNTMVQVALGAPDDTLGGLRFPEIVGGPTDAPFDQVIVADDQSLLAYFAPDLLGEDLPDWANIQVAFLFFDTWSDPFAEPVPEPQFRFAVATYREFGFLFWPFGTDYNDIPAFWEFTYPWLDLLCVQAGPPEARDGMTYDAVCDPERLGAVLN